MAEIGGIRVRDKKKKKKHGMLLGRKEACGAKRERERE